MLQYQQSLVVQWNYRNYVSIAYTVFAIQTFALHHIDSIIFIYTDQNMLILKNPDVQGLYRSPEYQKLHTD